MNVGGQVLSKLVIKHSQLQSNMSNTKKFEPSDAELEILQVLWKHQPATVKTVHEQLAQKREVGYTTILKQMQRMYSDKGMLQREKSGKLHLYTAVPQEKDIQQTMTDNLVEKAFRGSAMRMVMQALGQSDTTKEELDALQQWLDQQKEEDQ